MEHASISDCSGPTQPDDSGRATAVIAGLDGGFKHGSKVMVDSFKWDRYSIDVEPFRDIRGLSLYTSDDPVSMGHTIDARLTNAVTVVGTVQTSSCRNP